MGRNESLCIFIILFDIEMYSKSLERVGGISYCDISMVNIILLFNVVEYVNSRFYFFIFIEGFFFGIF